MKYDNYPSAFISDDLSVFEFISKGKKGEIRKRIVFTRTSMNGVYNLAFGRVTEENRLDDLSITDNGDRNKILATVVRAVDAYTRRYPTRWVYFMGSQGLSDQKKDKAVLILQQKYSFKPITNHGFNSNKMSEMSMGARRQTVLAM